MKTYTQIIVYTSTPLDDAQVSQAFKVSDQTQWWRALVQLIESYRSEFAAAAPQRAGENNALGLARDMGAYEALTSLLLELERRRTT
jgi:hypothetical protein